MLQSALDLLTSLFKRSGKAFAAANADLYVPLDLGSPPARLVHVRVGFNSEVSQVDYKLGIVLSVPVDQKTALRTFFATKPDDAVLFTATVRDGFVAHGLQANSVSYRKADVDSQHTPGLYLTETLVTPQITGFRLSRLEFADASGRNIGSMPISVIEPSLEVSQPQKRKY